MITERHVDFFLSIFKGREDIYARRWEKNGRSGYSPAYEFNWKEFELHRAKGGTMQSFQNKKLLPLNKWAIKSHLEGKMVVGIYPLLKDNTSYFIAADFDGNNWLYESRKFIEKCSEYQIPVYLERSRSGNGAHAWIFFEDKYPAYRTRKIVFEILKKAIQLSDFNHEASFDRLFPNQDCLTNLGFGNLIALPLNGESLKKGNSCFIQQESETVYPNQWIFLKEIKKLSIQQLNQLYNHFSSSISYKSDKEIPFKGFQIVQNNYLILQKEQLNPTIINFLKENLNFFNTAYAVLKKSGRSVHNVDKYFKTILEEGNEIKIPRGFKEKLIEFLRQNQYDFQLLDKRKLLEPIDFNSSIKLYPYQELALNAVANKDSGIIVAPPGSGKTVIGLEIITKKQQPALILSHRKQILLQWIERISSFLNIPKKEIGVISATKKKPGKQITVGMLQSIAKIKLQDSCAFGTIIIDECHHLPAKTFREVISKFNPYYLYGLTATPKRKYNDEKLIYAYTGDLLYTVPNHFKEGQKNQPELKICVKETDFYLPFNPKLDNLQLLAKSLIFDSNRNSQIISEVIQQIEEKRKILILTERKDHIHMLELYLKNNYEIISITGEDSASTQKIKMGQIRSGHFQAVLSTGQFFGEGIDIEGLDCLFLVYPFSFEGKLIQYIGRIQRSNKHQLLFDYRDSKIDYLDKLYKKRQRYYNKLQKSLKTLSIN